MKGDRWPYAVGLVLALAVLWQVLQSCAPRSPDAELARTTREAIQMARDVQQRADAARSAATVVRIAAMAAGVAGPLVVAYLIHRLHARSDATPEDMLDVLNGHKLIDWAKRPAELPPGDVKRISARPEGGNGQDEDSDELPNR